MRAKSLILFTAIVLLLNVRDAMAFGSFPVRDWRVSVQGNRFGFVDMHPGWYGEMDNNLPPFTLLSVGPFGDYQVPVSARVGSAIVILLVALLVLGGWKVFRWLHRRKLGLHGFEIQTARDGGSH